MSAWKILATVAFVLTLTSAASAQSAYTTGTIANSEAAGYPASGGYGSGLYAYAPGYVHGHISKQRR
jgi:hypothetical protein